MRIRLPIKSTADLAAIFNRQLSNASVLALESGFVEGCVDVLVLPNIRLFRVTLNAPVALYADRRLGKKVFSIDLSKVNSSDFIKAQGVTLTRPALFGFNANLNDLDLVLPSGSQMCTIVLDDDFLVAIEWIEDLGFGELLFSAGFFGSNLYTRATSQGTWTQMGVAAYGMNVEVVY